MTDTLELERRLRDEVAIFYGYATANEMLNSSDAPASWWENDTRWKAADALAAQREQIEALKLDRDEWKELYQREVLAHGETSDEQESAERKLAECERDAERYRWLNKHHDMALWVDNHDFRRTHIRLKCGPELDSWLDAAIDKARQDAKE